MDGWPSFVFPLVVAETREENRSLVTDMPPIVLMTEIQLLKTQGSYPVQDVRDVAIPHFPHDSGHEKQRQETATEKDHHELSLQFWSKQFHGHLDMESSFDLSLPGSYL